MTELKRTFTKNIKTSVLFPNDKVKDLLLKAAGAPADAANVQLNDQDGDSFWMDLQVAWSTTETGEVPE